MKYLRIYKMSNAEDFLNNDHLDFLKICTPSQQFHSIVPIEFRQYDNGSFKATNYMIIMETTKEEIEKLTELENENDEKA